MGKQDTTFEELLEASRLKSLLDDAAFDRAIAAAKAETEATERNKLTDRERAAKDILDGKRISRAIAAKPKIGRPKTHWRAKKRWRKNYYREVVVPKERQRRAALLEGDGWSLVHDYWHRSRKEYSITKEEWMENVEEYVTGKMFTVNRYDTTKPYSLDNIIVRQTSSDLRGAVLFDGKECLLRASGYIL